MSVEQSAREILRAIGAGKLAKIALFSAIATWGIGGTLGFYNAAPSWAILGELAGWSLLLMALAGLASYLVVEPLSRFVLGLVARLSTWPLLFGFFWLTDGPGNRVLGSVWEWLAARASDLITGIIQLGIIVLSFGVILAVIIVFLLVNVPSLTAIFRGIGMLLLSGFKALILLVATALGERIRYNADMGSAVCYLFKSVILSIYRFALWTVFGRDGIPERAQWGQLRTARPGRSWLEQMINPHPDDQGKQISAGQRKWIRKMEKALTYVVASEVVYHGNSNGRINYLRWAKGDRNVEPPAYQVRVKGRADRKDKRYAVFGIGIFPPLTNERYENQLLNLSSWASTLAHHTREQHDQVRAPFYDIPFLAPDLPGTALRVMFPEYRSLEDEVEDEVAVPVIDGITKPAPFGWTAGQRISGTDLPGLALLAERSGVVERDAYHSDDVVERFVYRVSSSLLSNTTVQSRLNNKVSVDGVRRLYADAMASIAMRNGVDGHLHWQGANELWADYVRVRAPIPSGALLEPILRKLSELRNEPTQIVVGLTHGSDPVLFDVSTQPHTLIGGASNRGKSVLTNSMIIQLLQSDPAEVRLLMFDLKQVELTQFSSAPHLARPVATTRDAALALLRNIEQEVYGRNALFANAPQLDGRPHIFQNIKAFNLFVEQHDRADLRLPHVVALIDEWSMLINGTTKDEIRMAAEIEGIVNQITKVARSAGVNFVIASQRGGSDVFDAELANNAQGRLALAPADNNSLLKSWEVLMGRNLNDDLPKLRDERGAVPLGRAMVSDGRSGHRHAVNTLFADGETIEKLVAASARRWRHIDPNAMLLIDRKPEPGIEDQSQDSDTDHQLDDTEILRRVIGLHTGGENNVLSRRQLSARFAISERRARAFILKLTQAGIAIPGDVTPLNPTPPMRLKLTDEETALTALAKHRSEGIPAPSPQPAPTEPTEPLGRALPLIRQLLNVNAPMVVDPADISARFELRESEVVEALEFLTIHGELVRSNNGLFIPA